MILHKLNSIVLVAVVVCVSSASAASADVFGTEDNPFSIEFVSVGNSGNADDAGAGGESYFAPYGEVDYNYRISAYEISQDMIEKATASGLVNVTAGAWSGKQPAANVSWFEAAAFVNWLNITKGHQAAYGLTYDEGWSLALWDSADAWQLGGENLYRHKDAYYFLPSEDEWYKAAYHKNDGVTANYWDYPTSTNDVPDGIDWVGDPDFEAVFWQGEDQGAPNDIDNAGSGVSAYGTYGQGGNILEWTESEQDGINDNIGDWDREMRGGYWYDEDPGLRVDWRWDGDPSWEGTHVGFRVASVPEPSMLLLLALAGLGLLAYAWRRRRS